MKHEKQLEIVRRLLGLPSNIVAVHGRENVPEFILHEMCIEDCFNITRAAYFVDNPDFDIFKGVCGYCHDDQFVLDRNIWGKADDFTHHMTQADFNKKVRIMEGKSPRHKCACDDEIVGEIAEKLGIENPSFHSWDLKFGNHGLLIYETHDDIKNHLHDDMKQACHMLSMCPIF